MLIEFSVKNFRSICDKQQLSMVASHRDELMQNVIDGPLSLLRAAVLYGPNASGKSNLIRSLWFMRELVVNSAKDTQQGESIPVDNFIFDESIKQTPTEFEMIFFKDDIRYQYEEWLYAYPLEKV